MNRYLVVSYDGQAYSNPTLCETLADAFSLAIASNWAYLYWRDSAITFMHGNIHKDSVEAFENLLHNDRMQANND